jgi:hypothetical protein
MRPCDSIVSRDETSGLDQHGCIHRSSCDCGRIRSSMEISGEAEEEDDCQHSGVMASWSLPSRVESSVERVPSCSVQQSLAITSRALTSMFRPSAALHPKKSSPVPDLASGMRADSRVSEDVLIADSPFLRFRRFDMRPTIEIS